jgi:hypothetical protein
MICAKLNPRALVRGLCNGVSPLPIFFKKIITPKMPLSFKKKKKCSFVLGIEKNLLKAKVCLIQRGCYA